MKPISSLGGYRPLLANRGFLTLWLAEVISTFGDAIFRVALLFKVTTLTSSPLALSAVIAAQAAPAIILGPLAGVWVDRLDKKPLLVTNDIFRALLLIAAVFSDQLTTLIIISALVSASTSIYHPARLAVMPAVVGEKNFMSAASLTQGTQQALHLVGPGVGGFLIALGSAQTWLDGSRLVFALDGLTFAISGLLILATSLPKVVSTSKTSTFFQDFRSGARVITKTPVLRWLSILFGAALLVVGGTTVLSTDYIRNVLLASPLQFGLIQSTMALGALVTTLAVGYWGERAPKLKLILWSLVGIGLVNLVFFIRPGIFICFAWALALGISDGANNTPFITLFISHTPQALRGRVMSFFTAMLRVTALTGLTLAGALAAQFSSAVILGMGGVALLAVAATAGLVPQGRALIRQEREERHEGLPVAG